MNKKNIIFAVIVLAAISAAVFVFWSCQSKEIGPSRKIVMGVDSSDLFTTPVRIAENQGYFQKEGIDVKMVEYPSGRTALADMISKGNLDVVTVAQTPVMYNSFTSDRYAIISGIAYSYDAGSLMLARQDKGIKTASDLKGRKIGTPIGSTGHFFLNLFLLHNRLRISDLEVVDIDAPHLPRAVVDGQVDAIAVWQPQIYIAQKLLGEKAVILLAKDIYRVDFYLVANRDFLNSNLEDLAKLLKAIDKAQNFIRQNKEDSIDIISRRLKLDRETVSALWDSYQFKMFLDQAIITDLEAEARWAIQNKYTGASRIPDYRNYIHAGILESIKPETVNMIR